MTSVPVLYIHAVATWFMTGLIWFVQVVHYPLFRAVGVDQFVEYEAEHQRRTTWVVGPVMLVELATAVAIVAGGYSVSRAESWGGLVALGLIWLSTAALQVPMHQRLSRQFDEGSWCKLVTTNWLRTLLWSARSVLAALWLV